MKNSLLIVILISIMAFLHSENLIASDEPLYDSMMTIYRTRAYDSAIAFANQALVTLRNSGEESSKQSARILHRMAACYQQKGDWSNAIREYKRAISMWRSLNEGDPLGLAASLGNIGEVYGDRGQFSESEAAIMEALNLKEHNLPDTAISLARTYQKVGGFYRRTGKYKLAEKYHLQAHKIYQGGSPKVQLLLLGNRNELAIVYHLQRRYEDAASSYEKVIDELKQMDSPNKWNGVLGVMGNLATLRGGQKDYAEAISIFNYGLSVIDSLNLNLPGIEAQYRGYLGATFFHMGRLAEAEENTIRSLEVLDSLWQPGNPRILERQKSLADIFRQTNRYAGADSLYSLVLEARIQSLGNRHPDVALTYLARSRLMERIGALDSAFAFANTAFSIRQRNFFEGVQVLSEEDALSYAHRMRVSGSHLVSLALQMPTLSDAALASTLSTLFTIKGAVTDDLITRQRFLRRIEDESIGLLARKHREVRAKIVELAIKPTAGVTDLEIKMTVDSLTEIAEQIESELSREGSMLQSYVSTGAVNIDSVAETIPAQTCLVEFLRADGTWNEAEKEYSAQYLAVILGSFGKRTIVPLASASEVDSVVGLYRTHFLDIASRNQYPLVEDAQAYNAIAQAVYQLIWQPLDSLIEGYETVIIAPDGALNLVSFAGLKNNSGRYLIEDKMINYVGAGRDLLRNSPVENKEIDLLAFGNPDYDATALQRKDALGNIKSGTTIIDTTGKSLPKAAASDCSDLASIFVEPLPSSRIEVQSILEVWNGSPEFGPAQSFYESAASEDNFKRFAGKQSVIHLSTHGFYLRADCDKSLGEENMSIDPLATRPNPLIYSGLLLAGSNLHGEGANEAGVEDGILTAEEISEFDLDGVGMVVLSACETGLGDIKNNEGVYGLRRAFQMAGAATVVSALWKVPALETATFFAELYKNSDEPLPNRFRRLQLAEMKRLRTAGFADHPFAWGAFIALGQGN